MQNNFCFFFLVTSYDISFERHEYFDASAKFTSLKKGFRSVKLSYISMILILFEQESQLMGGRNRRAENPGCPCART